MHLLECSLGVLMMPRLDCHASCPCRCQKQSSVARLCLDGQITGRRRRLLVHRRARAVRKSRAQGQLDGARPAGCLRAGSPSRVSEPGLLVSWRHARPSDGSGGLGGGRGSGGGGGSECAGWGAQGGAVGVRSGHWSRRSDGVTYEKGVQLVAQAPEVQALRGAKFRLRRLV